MNNMRVCHFSTVHNRQDVRMVYIECVSLAAAGYEVNVVIADGKGNEYINGIQFHDIGKYPNRLFRIIFYPTKIFFKIVSLKCSIYHFHDPELLFVGLFLKLFTKAKVVYDAHESYADFFLHKEYLPKLIRPLFSVIIKIIEKNTAVSFDEVITTTEYQAARIIGLNRHLDIIYNYPRLSEFSYSSEQTYFNKKRAICYIGDISEERGITQVIKAIESIDCVFHLAGSYAMPFYRNEIMQLPGWSKVIEHGYVNRKQAAEIIADSIIGIVLLLPKPNHLISHSTKIFEYMAGGIACLVPDFPIWKDIVGANECGVCVDPYNLPLISKLISDMLDNPELSRQMGAKGRRLVEEKYNWESEEIKLLDIYKRLLSDNSG